jgi:hypothetical protein
VTLSVLKREEQRAKTPVAKPGSYRLLARSRNISEVPII